MKKRVFIMIIVCIAMLFGFNLYGQSRTVSQELYDIGGSYPDNVIYPPVDGSVYFTTWIVERPEYVLDSRIHGHLQVNAQMAGGRFLCTVNIGNFAAIGAVPPWLAGETLIMEIEQEGTGRWARKEWVISPGTSPVFFYDELAIALQDPLAVVFDSRPPDLDPITTSATIMTGYPDDEGVYRANEWALDDYWQIAFSAEGVEDLEVTSMLRRQYIAVGPPPTHVLGPKWFNTQYSLDGVVWTDTHDDFVNWFELPNSEDWFTWSFALPESLNDQETIYIRWYMGTTDGLNNNGWGEIKDVVVTGENMPSPHPNVAVNPLPVNGAEGISVNLGHLGWSYFSQPIFTDPVGFRVYMNETGDFLPDDDYVWVDYVPGQNNYTTSELLDDVLEYETTYYWQVVPTTIAPDTRTRLRGDAENVPVWSFTTAIPLADFFEDFNAVATPNLPTGWSSIVESTDQAAHVRTWSAGTGANSPISPPNQIQMATGADHLLNLMLTTPPVTNFADNYLTFWAKITFATRTGDVIVGVMTDPSDVDSFVSVETIHIGLNSVYTRYGVLFPDDLDPQHIAFKLEADQNYTVLLIDDVGWQEVPDVINPPQDLVAVAGEGVVNLSWSAPAANTFRAMESLTAAESLEHNSGTREEERLLYGYNVYRDGVVLNDELIMETEYEDSDVVSFVTYQYYVTAVYLYGESEASNTAEATPFALNPPQNLTYDTEGLMVFLEWEEPEGPPAARYTGNRLRAGQGRTTRFEFLGYNVYRDNVVLNTELVTETEYTDSNVVNGQTYEYHVTAVYDEGESVASNSVTVTPYFLYPPLNLTATAGDGTVWLEWEAPNVRSTVQTSSGNLRGGTLRNSRLELLGYNVYRDGVMINTTLVIPTEYEDTDVVNDVNYIYYITAVYDEGESGPSNEAGATPFEPVYLPPQNLTAEVVDDNNVQLDWEAPVYDGWIHWDSGTNVNGVGTGGALVFKAAIRFSSDNLDDMNAVGRYLRKVRFYPRQAAATYSINIWTGGSETDPGNLVLDQPVPSPQINAWNTVNLLTPVYIEEGEELWIGYHIDTTTGHPAGCDAGPAIDGYGNMMYFNNEWTTLLQVSPTLNYNWNIQGLISVTPGREVTVLEQTGINSFSDSSHTGSMRTDALELSPDFGFDPVVNSMTRLIPTGYRVYRNGEEIAETDSETTSYFDEELAPGDYDYYVTALYDDEESEPSNTVDVYIEDLFPYPPQNLSFDVLEEINVLLTWDVPVPDNNLRAARNSRNLMGFNVYRDDQMINTELVEDLEYLDEGLEEGTYVYYVTAVYTQGESEPSNEVTVVIVSVNDETAIPLVTALQRNYPNPFNPETTIAFSLKEDDFVTIEVYNSRGQKVRTLVNEFREAGNHQVLWNGRDENSREVASGVYFYRMKSGRYTSTGKMLMMK